MIILSSPLKTKLNLLVYIFKKSVVFEVKKKLIFVISFYFQILMIFSDHNLFIVTKKE